MQKWTKGAAILAALAAGPIGCDNLGRDDGAAEEGVPSEAPTLDPELAAHLPPGVSFEEAQLGQELFPVCAVCHGFEGEGTQLGSSLRDGEWTYGSGELGEIERIVRTGISDPADYPIPMPPGGGGDFDDEEIRGLAAYVMLLSRSGSAEEPEPAPNEADRSDPG